MKGLCSRYLMLAAALFAAGALGSCGDSGWEPPVSASGRTVVAYLAADSDLYVEVADKIAALCRGRAEARAGELLIYADTPQGARLLRALPDGTAQTVAEYGRENSASPSVLNRVLCEVQAAYPAAGYGLVFFSHGSGWLPQGALQRPVRSTRDESAAAPAVRSIGRDETDAETVPAEMELEAFVSALPAGMLDFVVFEACLMAGVEVAYALRDKVDYMLASSAEILSPGFMPVYGSSLRWLLDASTPVPECLAAFGRAYMTHVRTLQGVYRSATLSVVDLRETEPLAARMADLPPLLFDGSDTAEELQRFDRPGRYGESPALARYFDLEACVECRASAVQAASLREQLTRTVVWKDRTVRFMVGDDGDYDRYGGFDIAAHSGLTVYLPRPELEGLNEAYRLTAWHKAVSGL